MWAECVVIDECSRSVTSDDKCVSSVAPSRGKDVGTLPSRIYRHDGRSGTVGACWRNVSSRPRSKRPPPPGRVTGAPLIHNRFQR